MKVKFTNPLNDKQVLFGAIVEMFNDRSFVVQADIGISWVIDPNSDYNFRFIPNEESDNKFQERLNAVADELDALEKSRKKDPKKVGSESILPYL